MKKAKLDANWLAQEMAEVSSDYAMSWPPGASTMSGRAGADAGLLSPYDAGRLRDKMAARYHAWTGRSLAVDLRATPDPA